jgi:NAD(P)-dependent dehydrogenase (short-subunit alcohol dehydrogenase family)
MAAFSTADLPDLSGQTVIVTGANSGIGRAVARRLWSASEELTGVSFPDIQEQKTD